MNQPPIQQRLQTIPAVGRLLEHEEVIGWLRISPRAVVVDALRQAVDDTRNAVLAGREVSTHEETVLSIAEHYLARASMPSLVRVINATGIVLHTGLGRAPLCAEAIEAVAETAAGYCNLEIDLHSGDRGRRSDHVSERLRHLTGAEAATVVNNNAAATLLVLKTLADGREVIVSRGQLVEIGGSYRLPEVMAASGAVLREVGTTNRTRIEDYADAIHERTAAILRVHTSNYKIVGFTEEASLDELIALAHDRGLPMIDDVGSGAMLPIPIYQQGGEPTVSESLHRGADVVCFSGDKLLGGPQCGIIVGKSAIITSIEKHPLMRTYRVDKMTLAALEATLRHWSDAEHAREHIPVLQMLHRTTEALSHHASQLLELFTELLPDENFQVCSASGFAGGGSLPASEMESVIIEWRPAQITVVEAACRLRGASPPVLARVHGDAVCFDLRTVDVEDFEELAEAVAQAAEDEQRGLTVIQ